MSLFNPERAGLRSGAFHQKLHQVGIEPHCFAFIVFSFLCYSYVKWYQFSVYVQFSSVQLLSHVWLFVTPWTAAHQISPSITNFWACSNSHPSSWWCHPTISSSVVPFSSCLQSFPASGSFPWVSSSHQVAKVLPFMLVIMHFPLKIELSLKREAISRKTCGKE